MKDKQVEGWRNTRSKGKKHYIFVSGILLWGVPMYVILALILNRPESGFTVVYLIGNSIVWLLAGTVYGNLMWSNTEKKYHAELMSREST